jgi:GT2 family glycosyltransferase
MTQDSIAGGNMNNPEMSVVLVTPDRYSTIRRTIAHLRMQTARRHLELVIVAPSAQELELDESELKEFFRFVVVEVGEIKSIGAANAVGIHKATAPIVALAEDHVFPDPQWGEAFIRAHQEEWAAVGPEVANANPNSLISWADFVLGYGPWMKPASAGVVRHLPGHNSSYKRSHLLEYGSRLENMMEAETVLHWDLQTKGYQLYLEPRAKIRHMNFGLLRSWIPAQFYSGRLFAAVRSQSWSGLRRLAYTCAAPLIPVVRLNRMLRYFNHLKLQVLPILILGLAVSALGEMMGYAFGTGNARKKLTQFEFHRVRHVAQRR